MAVFTVTLACRRTSAFIFKDVDAEVERIKEAMGAEVDITFDCAGFNKTMSTAFGATSSSGKVCLVGMGHSEMTLPLAPAAVRQFICIGRFTAVSFQVLGHMKTILVLILRFLFFKKEGLNLQVVIGMVIAVIGMVWYGNASSKPGGKERRSSSIPRAVSKNMEDYQNLLRLMKSSFIKTHVHIRQKILTRLETCGLSMFSSLNKMMRMKMV